MIVFVDVMEEQKKFTMLTRDNKSYLPDRYCKGKKVFGELSKHFHQKAI